MGKIPKLTASQENYLEMIWRLSRRGPVRVSAIARMADVRLPSVTKAIGKLVTAGLVEHDAYGVVLFTELGRQAAESVIRRDNCLFRLLTEVLCMEEKKAAMEVCRIEHVISDGVLERLEVLVAQATDKQSQRWRTRLQAKLSELPKSMKQGLVGCDEPHPGVQRAGDLFMESDSN